MIEDKELQYYEETKDWNFDKFQIETESLTKWDFYDEIRKLATKNSKILDLGTGGGERVLKEFPEYQEILGTDYSKEMINTANKNLLKSGKQNISFKVMDNLDMKVPDNYYDIVVARNTPTDPKQIYKCLKKGGYLLIHGVDMYDCHSLKLLFKRGQGFLDKKTISIVDYEKVLNAGFKDVELVPIHKREYFKNKELFVSFLRKVPIIDDFDKSELDQKVIDQYISENTYDERIRLLRRYYGIVAKK